MGVNYVNRIQPQQVVTPCTAQLKRNRNNINIDFQKELLNDSDEESTLTELANKKRKQSITQSSDDSENDGDHHDDTSSGDNSSILVTPKNQNHMLQD